MIRVLRIIARLNVGGPAIQTITLGKHLSGSKFDSILACGTVSEGEGDMGYLAQREGVYPIIIPEMGRELSFLNDLKAFFKLRRIIKKYQPHLIHTHTAKAGTLGRLAAISFLRLKAPHNRIKLVHTFHGHVFHGYFSRTKTALFLLIERFLGLCTDAMVAISESQKNELIYRFRIAAPGQFRKIELGFNLTPFLECRRHRDGLRGKIGADEQTVLIGIVGRLVPIKNHHLFLESVRIFLERNPSKKTRFLIVGDGELRGDLEHLSHEFGLDDRVVFMGWIKDVSEVYADLDILVLTSINEGTPVSLIEGMASSVPVLATDAGGVKDLFGRPITEQNGFMACERGILCPQNDPEIFANAVEYQLNLKDLEKQKRLRKARDFVVNRYSNERLVRDIKALYLDLLSVDLSD